MTNPIIEEIRAARAALAAEHGYDIKRITEWARHQTEALKRTASQLTANRVEVTGLRPSPLPHHPACGSTPGGSSKTR